MIFTKTPVQTPLPISPLARMSRQPSFRQYPRRLIQWLFLLLACIGACWFAVQVFLVPQPERFTVPWHNAQWIEAADSSASTAYFRYTTSITIPSDTAYVEIAANQIFRLYVNGTFIASNSDDIVKGGGAHTHIYDVTSALTIGTNIVGIRVVNLDQQKPAIRALFGVVNGSTTIYHGSGSDWQATAQSSLVYPAYNSPTDFNPNGSNCVLPSNLNAGTSANNTLPNQNVANLNNQVTNPNSNGATSSTSGSTPAGSAGTTTTGTTTAGSTPNQLPTQSPAQCQMSAAGVAQALPGWITNTFDASRWPSSLVPATQPSTPLLTENPILYQYPLSARWMSAGKTHDAYFVRTIPLPLGTGGAWLRIGATGPATIFINGQEIINWDGTAPEPPPNIADYLSDQETVVRYQQGLLIGLYDVSPYLHAGNNTIAVHVTDPGNSTSQTGLNTYDAALALDIYTRDIQNRYIHVPSSDGWQASKQVVDGWEQVGSNTSSWVAPLPVGRPGLTLSLYVPENPTPRNTSSIPLPSLLTVIIGSVAAVLAIWFLIAGLARSRYNFSATEARRLMSLAYLPALAFEMLLIALSHEPQMPQPFPYTWQWGIFLLFLVAVGYLLLWLNADRINTMFRSPLRLALPGAVGRSTTSLLQLYEENSQVRGLIGWLRLHWGVVVLIVIALPLISYNLPYEPYWQDELTSYYAAKGILAHGLPLLPSGFWYTKAELYSYLLAGLMAIFGDQQGIMRLPAVLEYLVSIPLLYYVGCYFFDRYISLLATAMMAFSPSTLVWGRQMRMYEQAQLLTILTFFLFYKALREPQRPRLVYLAVASLCLAYLSHEEIFITFPAFLVCLLLANYMESQLVRAKFTGIKRHLPPLLFQKHWWYGAIIAAVVIGLQLASGHFSHPPILGTDQSQQPMIQVSTENLVYYFKLMFIPFTMSGAQPWITLNSLLAVVGCIWGIRAGDARATYLGLLLFISVLTLGLLFTLTADRYIYPLLPIMYLVGSFALLNGLRALWRVMSSPLESQKEGSGRSSTIPYGPLRLIMAMTQLLICATVLVLPMLPISGYNLFVSRTAGFLYHRHYADYDAAGQYMQTHWKPGDIVISVSPAISIKYYVGHLDYFFSIDRSLYLFERNGTITDTPTGTTPMLSQSDFQAVLASHLHNRVWILSDNGQYQSAITKTQRFIIPPEFHIVFEGYGSAVYVRGG
ncbi:MAG TPA: glycosyltransferase family 39 protein [Ktedonosporobacter sp.]|nr:glycosyltransferase family 39 protein [Ktedonosporobacter sp.]